MADSKITQFLVTHHKQGCGIDFVVYFQTLKEAFGILPTSAWDRITSGRILNQDRQVLQTLHSADVLIPADTDEFHAYRKLQEKRANSNHTVKSRILPTERCSNDCLFCISRPSLRQRTLHMTEQTARRMDHHYCEFIDRKRPRSAFDVFLGGEPFLAYRVMRDVARRRHSFCQKRGIKYAFSITTNGRHLTVRRIGELLQYGLESLHVSLAGPADVHDRLRPSAGGSGNYRLVLRKLAQVSHMVDIQIEYQYDTTVQDYLRIGEMNDDFLSTGIGIVGISASPIMPRREDNLFAGGAGDPAAARYVNDWIHNAGYPVYDRLPSMMCIVDADYYHVYLPDGRIAGCPAIDPSSPVDAKHFVCGHVETGIDFLVASQQTKRHYPDRCKSCALLPLCGGGCRYMASLYHGDPSAVMCYHDHLQGAVERYLDHRAETELHALERSGGLDYLAA